MKLILQQAPTNQHKETCVAVGWSSSNELFSCADDKTILKWNLNGDLLGKICDVDSFVTQLHWFPSHSKKTLTSTSAIFVVSCVDGTFRIVSGSGRVEKIVKEAHVGAIVCLRWNYEGTALATGGEDGIIKIWSRGGQLRSTLASTGKSVYSLAWGPTSESVLFTSGKDLIIKQIHAAAKQMQWKAHDGPVTKVDWNPLTKMIVSSGEDGRWKVWDSFGRNLFSSAPFDHAITSVSWSPDGELLAVGSFNLIKICDKTGCTYSSQQTVTGSIQDLSWTSDGTQIAAAGGNGAVLFGQLIDRKLEWRNLVVSLVTGVKIKVHDILNDNVEELEFRDKVIKMSLGFSHLIVATSTQCWIYDATNWTTPHVFDVKDTVNLVLQSKKTFLTIDNFAGIQIYTYEGRLLSNPKFYGLRTEFLDMQTVSLSGDVIAIVDKGEKKSKAIQFFETSSGKPLAEPITHTMDILEIALNQFGAANDRKIAFIDRNRDLYISPVRKEDKYKLATMVDSVKWNDQTDMLVAISDGKLVVWYLPGIVYVDRDMLPAIRITKEDLDVGKKSQIIDFFGTKVNLRKMDGSILTTAVSPFPLILYEQVEKKEWKSVIRLCRFVKEPALWACLAAMSIKAGELSTAEISFAALEEVEKLQYIQYIKRIPTPEGRSAALALFQRRIVEAETILLQAGLIYRAIKMHIKLYNWNRALEIAASKKSHIDTVKYYRKKYLDAFDRKETNQAFLQYEAIVVNEATVKEKIKFEKQQEMERAKPYISEF